MAQVLLVYPFYLLYLVIAVNRQICTIICNVEILSRLWGGEGVGGQVYDC